MFGYFFSIWHYNNNCFGVGSPQMIKKPWDLETTCPLYILQPLLFTGSQSVNHIQCVYVPGLQDVWYNAFLICTHNHFFPHITRIFCPILEHLHFHTYSEEYVTSKGTYSFITVRYSYCVHTFKNFKLNWSFVQRVITWVIPWNSVVTIYVEHSKDNQKLVPRHQN